MPKLSEKGAIQFVVLLILLFGIVATVYLSQKTQIFKPKASSDKIEWIKSSGQDPDNCITEKGTTTCPKVKFRINIPVQVNGQ